MFFVLSAFLSNAQEQNSNCDFNYQINISPTKSDLLESLQEAQMNWDFSKVKLNKDSVITIEVLPIFDCFNGQNASDFKEIIIIKSSDSKFKSKGGYLFKHLDLMSKCFKWRVIIKSSNCEEISDWKYYSFLK
jgi:hypothetical protein